VGRGLLVAALGVGALAWAGVGWASASVAECLDDPAVENEPVPAQARDSMRRIGAALDDALEALSVSQFRMYCVRCHQGGQGPGPDLPLEDLGALASYKGGLVALRLKGQGGAPMPPSYPLDVVQPSAQVRNELIEVLQPRPPIDVVGSSAGP
jgi:hypothetical protein